MFVVKTHVQTQAKLQLVSHQGLIVFAKLWVFTYCHTEDASRSLEAIFKPNTVFN